MLKTLSIENYALIDKSIIDFQDGFSVITGETGAGKSILLGALNLVLGQRADSKVMKDINRKCLVEAVFDISGYELQSFFEENELDFDEECIIRREIGINGKSRSFINDTPISVSILKDLGDKLIDIHSQHENLLLNDNKFQLRIIDTVSGDKKMLQDYEKRYVEFRTEKKELEELIALSEKESSDKEFIEFQADQLEKAELVEGEQETLESESETLEHSEEIKNTLSKVLWLLCDGEQNVNGNLKEAINALTSILSVYSVSDDVRQRLDSCFIELKEVVRELDVMQNDIEVDPLRLDQVNERLDMIYSLEKKHNVSSVKELLSLQLSMKERLQQLDSYSEKIEELSNKIQTLENQLNQLAENISQIRKASAPKIEEEMKELLHNLGMPNAKFSVEFKESGKLLYNGKDEVSFLFSANKDRNLQPISLIASGGEISRVMLGLKSIISRNSGLPAIIFDEIDTGVSGEIANKMGIIMQQMGESMQVISITHLPQIASKGNVHYKVYKKDNEGGTVSGIKRLSFDERVNEIAQMLSGANLTDAAIRNAQELLENSL